MRFNMGRSRANVNNLRFFLVTGVTIAENAWGGTVRSLRLLVNLLAGTTLMSCGAGTASAPPPPPRTLAWTSCGGDLAGSSAYAGEIASQFRIAWETPAGCPAEGQAGAVVSNGLA